MPIRIVDLFVIGAVTITLLSFVPPSPPDVQKHVLAADLYACCIDEPACYAQNTLEIEYSVVINGKQIVNKGGKIPLIFEGGVVIYV